MLKDILSELYTMTRGLPQGSFGLLYGSQASGNATEDSDIDVMFFTADDRRPSQSFIAGVIDMHKRHHCAIDVEVPYESKLFASRNEAAAAFTLAPFLTGKNRVVVPALAKDTPYMGSDNMKQRMILNALTSPHIFVGGDWRAYMQMKMLAQKTMTIVAVALLDQHEMAIPELITALKWSDTGQGGEDHLGYKVKRGVDEALWETLSTGLDALIKEGWVEPLGESSFRVTDQFPYTKGRTCTDNKCDSAPATSTP